MDAYGLPVYLRSFCFCLFVVVVVIVVAVVVVLSFYRSVFEMYPQNREAPFLEASQISFFI